MMATKYTASFEGQVFTRKSDRTYACVVICKGADGWFAASWARTLPLGAKKAASERKHWPEVKVVPVEVP